MAGRRRTLLVTLLVAVVFLVMVVSATAQRGAARVTKTTIEGKDVLVLPALKEIPIPAGMILPYAGGLIPDGWLLCDGSYVKIDNGSQRLARAISTDFGGDGAKYIRLPDLRGRTVVGLSNMGAEPPSPVLNEPWAKTRGKDGYGGNASHSLAMNEIPRHDHPGSAVSGLGSHTHFIAWGQSINRGGPGPEFSLNPGGEPGPRRNTQSADNQPEGAHTHGLTITPQGGLPDGSADAFSIVQPSVALNYLIKY